MKSGHGHFSICTAAFVRLHLHTSKCRMHLDPLPVLVMNCLVHHYDLSVLLASQTEVEHALQLFAFCNFTIKLSEMFLKFYPIKTVIIDYLVSYRGARNLSTIPIVSSSFCGGPDIDPLAWLVMNESA